MRKRQVTDFTYRLFRSGAISFMAMGTVNLVAGKWEVALGLWPIGLILLGLWLTSEPRNPHGK